MKITVNGNICTIKSDVNFAALKQLGRIDVYDENGNNVYAAATGDLGTIGAKGVMFSYADCEGKASLNVAVPTMQSESETKSALAKGELGAGIRALLGYESYIKAAIEEKMAETKKIEEMIEVQ